MRPAFTPSSPRAMPRPMGCSRCAPPSKPTSKPANRSPLRRNRCWPSDMVRYAGEPVALIVAETRNLALDAAEHIVIDSRRCRLSPLPSPRAPRRTGDISRGPGNVCLDWRTGNEKAVDAAFAAAAHVVTLQLDNHRIVTNPMEPRGAVGAYDGRKTATPCMSPARTSMAIATPPRAH